MGERSGRDEVRERYGRFAVDEAGGRSALYEDWARGITADEDVLEVLARIPASRRQPPLVFAVARLLGAPLEGYPVLRSWILGNADDLVAEASRRSLQTNEPLRCALLLPALAGIDAPIALIEVGASAGLCLYPDRYGYRYRGAADVALPGAPVLEAELRGPFAPPVLRHPEIVWRAGVDLSPLDAAAPRDRAFLTGLVWPGETGRENRIRDALDVVAEESPRIVAGDASDPGVLRALAAEAPSDAALVVTTPGVLPHIPREGRRALARTIAELGAVWVSIEPAGIMAEPPAPYGPSFVLRLDDDVLASCDPLGGWMAWRAG